MLNTQLGPTVFCPSWKSTLEMQLHADREIAISGGSRVVGKFNLHIYKIYVVFRKVMIIFQNYEFFYRVSFFSV